MMLFDEDSMKALREALAELKEPVKVEAILGDSEYDELTRELLKAIEEAAPDELVKVDIKSPREGEKHPQVILLDGRIRYLGAPIGEEMKGFIETLIRASNKDSGLSNDVKEKIRSLPQGKAVIEVIVTPQCPYCPYASFVANMLALEAYLQGSPLSIESVTVEAYENKDIAEKYKVYNVPAIAINGELVQVGVPDPSMLLREVEKRIIGLP